MLGINVKSFTKLDLTPQKIFTYSLTWGEPNHFKKNNLLNTKYFEYLINYLIKLISIKIREILNIIYENYKNNLIGEKYHKWNAHQKKDQYKVYLTVEIIF